MTSTLRSRVALIGATLLLSLAACHTGTLAPTPRSASQDTALINRDITYLASDALEGRGTGTAGNDTAAAYIARLYTSLDLPQAPVAGTKESCPADFTVGFRCSPPYMQRFFATSVAAAHAGLSSSLPTQNVVAIVKGSDPVLTNEYVVFGAHFDHLGRNIFGAMDPDSGALIRHGADDNASGTAAVMELARIFARHPTKRSLMFINFSGEELGTLGSMYFVEHPPVALESMIIMLNFDMIGRLRDQKLLVYGVATATQLKPLVDSMNTAIGHFDVAAIGDGYGPSDHASFYGAGVPVLHFFTGAHADYHKPSDAADKINQAGVVQIGDLAAAAVLGADLREARLTYKSAPAPISRGDLRSFNASLGVVPDYAGAPVGMPPGVYLAGVRPGGPAEKAGLQRADLIVHLGPHALRSVEDLMFALNASKPGETVTATVIREGKEMKLQVTFGEGQARR